MKPVLCLFLVALESSFAHVTIAPSQTTRAQAGRSYLTTTQENFLSKIFPVVGLRTIERRYSGPLRAAVETEKVDEESLAKQLAELTNTLDGLADVDTLLKEVAASKSEAESKEIRDDKWIRLLDRLLWAGKRLKTGEVATDKEAAPRFSDLFKGKFDEVDKQMKEVREAVKNGKSAFLRDPKNLDHEGLTHYLMHTKDREFAGQLAQHLGWDNSLYLQGGDGKTYAFSLGQDPGKALSELKNVPGADTARVATQKTEPEKTWQFENNGWIDRTISKPRQIPTVNANATATAMLLKRCTECHDKTRIESWSPETVLKRITSTDPKIRMPKDEDPLPESDIALVRAWVLSEQSLASK